MDVWFLFGILVIIAGLFDGWKYKLITAKVKKYQSSRGQSRLSLNYAIVYKILLLVWSVFYLKDVVVTLSCIVALYTLCELYWTVYLNYPYKYRNLLNFKKPNFFKYFVNSWLPNRKKYRI